MDCRFTISAFTANTPGVLQRITTLFTRRKLNIESLTVSETERHDTSRFTIVVSAKRDVAETVARQIKRFVDVQDVYLSTDEELVFREVAFVKVFPQTGEARERLLKVLETHKATVAFENETGICVERTGTEEETTALVSALDPFLIKEFVRSGRIAMLKGARAADQLGLSHQAAAGELLAEDWI